MQFIASNEAHMPAHAFKIVLLINRHNFSLFLYKILPFIFRTFSIFSLYIILCKSFLSDYFFDTINLDKTGLSWLGFEAQGEGFAKVCFVFRICLCKYRNNNMSIIISGIPVYSSCVYQ